MVVEAKTVVTLSYTLSVKDLDGTSHALEVRSSQNPVEFVFGHEILLPAVEKKILKKSQGYKTTLILSPSEAFGEPDPSLETWYELSKLPKGLSPQVGLKFQTQGPQGDVISVIVKEIKDGKVLLDGNHPLAGETLEFELEILRIRAATDEESVTGQVKTRFH